jgi:hypothetical protein
MDGSLIEFVGLGARGTRPGTRGANRGEKEDFKMAMKRQALREVNHKKLIFKRNLQIFA